MVGGTSFFWAFKRVEDLLLAVLLFPVLIMTGFLLLVLNPVLNPGPLLFFQTRVGQGGGLFTLIKFRTMRIGAGSPCFADAEAHRISVFGRFLRRYRLDELPQLVNVLRGDMSLIGPRPEQPDFARTFEARLPGYGARHVVRPGLSGLSQVIAGYTSDFAGTQRKLALDLHYIRQCGFGMEWFVFRRTLVTIVTGRGAM